MRLHFTDEYVLRVMPGFGFGFDVDLLFVLSRMPRHLNFISHSSWNQEQG